MTKHLLALEKDLFFSVKIRDTLRHHGMEVTIARSLPAFAQRLTAAGEDKPSLVIINTAIKDIDWEAAIRLAHMNNLPILAFGSHMDLDARSRALRAGAERVVANSKFTSDMPALVERLLSGSAPLSQDAPGEEE